MADERKAKADFECETKAEFEASIALARERAKSADLLQKSCKENASTLSAKLSELAPKLRQTYQKITDRLWGRDLLGPPLEDNQLTLLAKDICDMRGRCEKLQQDARSILDFDNLRANLKPLTDEVKSPPPAYTDWKLAQDLNLTGRHKEWARNIDAARANLAELNPRLAGDVVTVTRTGQEVQKLFTEQVSTVIATC